MKKLFLFLSLITFSLASQATHIAGAEIWYEHDTLNTYTVHLKLYRDCGPGTATIGPTALVKISSATFTTPSTFFNMIVDTTGTNIPFNPSVVYTCVPNTCSNPSAVVSGYELWHYKGTVTLPGQASDWVMSYDNCCRNNTSNLVGTPGTYVSTTLDNLTVPFNNGLSIPYDVLYNYTGNVNHSVSFAAIEPDGDSLDYRFTNPLSNTTSMVPFSVPHTAQNPFPNSTLSLNAQTGVLNFTATTTGNYVFAIETREFRNGVLIGRSTRDHQVEIGSGIPGNNLPTISGINGGTSFANTINYCGGNVPMFFNINTSDANVLDSTTVVLVSGPVGATISTNTAQNQTATFNWPLSQSLVRSQPYILVLEVRDNNCGIRQQVYELFVNNCNTDSVWAGDANADFTCDNYDILNIGIANGATGAVRAGATTNWQAEWCLNWTNNFVSNINYKHADCNGDGTVNTADLAAVTANYGQIHTKTNKLGQYKTLGLPDLYCDLSNLQAYKGSTVNIPVMLGTITSLANDFYGISATVELLNAQTSAPISVTKNVSWIGNASNSFSFEKSLTSNKSAFTFVRNDQQNLIAQQGQIGAINFPIDAASITGSKVIVQFSNIKMIQNSGEEITDYNVLTDTMTILAPLAINDFEKRYEVNVYPNPTESAMTINLNFYNAQQCEILLYDLVGRVVDATIFNGKIAAGEHQINLDLSTKAQGQYLLEVKTESGKTTLPVHKQ